jgi:Uma2 family endonuclease
MSTTTAPMTIEEFLKLPEVEGEKMELIHGEVVSIAYAGFVHERVKSNINKILVVWLDRHPFGQVFLETTYRTEAMLWRPT